MSAPQFYDKLSWALDKQLFYFIQQLRELMD